MTLIWPQKPASTNAHILITAPVAPKIEGVILPLQTGMVLQL